MSRRAGQTANPNAKFRTYSYHHILAICDSVATAEAVSEASLSPTFFGSGSTSDHLKVGTVGGGTFFTVINGLTDAHFVIRRVEWESFYATHDKRAEEKSVSTNVIASFGGEMVIEEPGGIDFLNTLALISSELNANPNSQVFLLKTIFVGHSDATSDEQPIVDASFVPMLLKPWDIEADIKASGVTYNFKFISVVNGSATVKHYDNVELKGGFQFPKFGTLGETLAKYQQELNAQLERERAELLKKASESGGDLAGLEIDTRKQVEYEFNLDESLKSLPAGTNTKIADQTTAAFDPSLDFSNKGMVGSLADIMQSSEEVVKRIPTNGANKDTIQQTFKITPVEDIQKDKVIIKYYITPYENPIDPPAAQGGRFTPPDEDVLEFNYIFTGLNTDIKDIDLKLSLGQQLYQAQAISNSRPTSNIEYDANKPVGGFTGANQPPNSGGLTNRPLSNSINPPPTTSGSNYGSGPETIDYFENLRRFITLSNISVKMTIVGNPTLLSESILTPSKVAALFNQSSDEGRLFDGYSKNPLKAPTYVKLNIKYPAKNADYSNLQLLYDGHYTILTIKNIFDDGEFTQELDLLAVSEKDPVSDSARVATDTAFKQLAQQRGQGRGGAITTAQAAPGKFKPKKGPDGKYNFSPEVNEAISKAAKKHGVDETFMRNMCYIESKGNPNAVSPTGAKGLFQFVGGTATQYGIRGREFDIDANADAAARFAKDNQNSLERAGIEATPQNLYIAHQQGAGGARSLHRFAGQGLEYNQLPGGLQNNMRVNNSAGLSAQGYINKWNSKYDEVDSRVADAGTPSTATDTEIVQSTTKTAQAAENVKVASNDASEMIVKEKLARSNKVNLAALPGE